MEDGYDCLYTIKDTLTSFPTIPFSKTLYDKIVDLTPDTNEEDESD
jgi:hypothetical protein